MMIIFSTDSTAEEVLGLIKEGDPSQDQEHAVAAGKITLRKRRI